MNIDPIWPWTAAAIANAVTAFFVYRNTQATAAAARAAEAALASSQANHELVRQTREDIRTVEKATNSMQDALVKATRDASLAQGRAEVTAENMAAARLADEPKT